jgi:methionyl aminopeptidase
MYVLKTRREIEMMRRAGQVACNVLAKMREAAVAGISTGELDMIAREEMLKEGAVSGSRNYPTYEEGKGFPGWTCVSINEEIVHGIPGKRVLKEGDVVSLDVALHLNGYCADTCATVPIGKVSPLAQKLLDITKATLSLAVENIRPGRRWSDVARIIQKNVEKNGFAVVREFVGHGIGRSMHEDPKVPNFVTGEGLRGDFELRPGMTLAVEPMVVAGKRDVRQLKDNWTMVTVDSKPAAHFEHTIAVTDVGVDVLTDGRRPFTL